MDNEAWPSKVGSLSTTSDPEWPGSRSSTALPASLESLTSQLDSSRVNVLDRRAESVHNSVMVDCKEVAGGWLSSGPPCSGFGSDFASLDAARSTDMSLNELRTDSWWEVRGDKVCLDVALMSASSCALLLRFVDSHFI